MVEGVSWWRGTVWEVAEAEGLRKHTVASSVLPSACLRPSSAFARVATASCDALSASGDWVLAVSLALCTYESAPCTLRVVPKEEMTERVAGCISPRLSLRARSTCARSEARGEKQSEAIRSNLKRIWSDSEANLKARGARNTARGTLQVWWRGSGARGGGARGGGAKGGGARGGGARGVGARGGGEEGAVKRGWAWWGRSPP